MRRSRGISRFMSAITLAVVAVSSLGATAAIAQSPTAVPLAPPTALTLSTTYPSITVDPGGTAKFPLQVTSPVVERVDLTVNGAPDGWTTTLKGGGLIIGSVTTTGTSESPALELDVKVPDGTAPSTQQLRVLASAQAVGDNAGMLRPWLDGATVAEKNGWLSDTRTTAAIVHRRGRATIVVVELSRPGVTYAEAKRLGRRVLLAADLL